MDLISKDIISLLIYLLPGFITAWIYYGLTAFPKPNQFERIVQALIFTIIIQSIVIALKYILIQVGENLFYIGTWNNDVKLILSTITALVLGLSISHISNNDQLYRILRKYRFTSLTSYPSEWYGVFALNKTYVVLHLEDGRRLYGWPIEWPSQPDSGHFSISQAEWLTDTNSIKLDKVKTILIPANSVKFVEFMKLNKYESDNYFIGEENGPENASTSTFE